MKNEDNPDAIDVVLLVVHLSQETMDKLSHCAERASWALIPLLYDNYFTGDKLPSLTQRATEAKACIAVIDFDVDRKLALQTAQRLRQSSFQKIEILAYSSTTDPDMLLRAMRAGYSGFLGSPLDPDQFAETLNDLEQRWSATLSRPQNKGKILSFFGAKGGVGTTTLAVHLAVYLVRNCGKKVLLIDSHPQLGHVSLYLGMDSSRHHFNDLLQNVSRLDQELLRGFLATHSSGLNVLSSPDVYGAAWKTDADSVERTLDFLSSQYDFIVLDCEASFEEINLAVTAISSWIYLIATPEIGAIRDLSRYVDGLMRNEEITSKLQVVINRYSSHEAVTTEQIEKAVHLPIAIQVANNYSQLVQSINIGEPVGADTKGDFAVQLKKWSISLGGEPATVEQAPVKKRFALWK